MLNIKETCMLAALLLVSLVSADQSLCKDCIGDSLVNLVDKYQSHRQCWITKYNNILLKEKLYSMEAIVDCLSNALNVNNNLAEPECKSVVELKSCTMEDKNAMSECLMASLRTVVVALRNQEQCHGKAFKTDEMRVSTRIIKGNIIGWSSIHPDC